LQSEMRPQSPWIILVCMWFMGFALETPLLCVSPILHIITKELSLSHAQAGIIFSVPMIILAAIAIPGGALADRIGIRKAAGIGIIIIIIGNLLRGTSTNFATLLTFTCLYGVGFGIVFPNLPKLTSACFPPEKIGFATGIYTTGIVCGIALALAITLPVVYPVTGTFQGVFYIWTIPAVVAAIMWWTIIREPHQNDLPNKQSGEINISLLRILTNGNLWLIAAIFFLGNYIAFSWLGWAPQLIMSKGAPPTLAAIISSVMSWVSIPLTFIAPWASDKIGSRKLFLWPSFLLLSLALVSAIYASVPFYWVIVVMLGIAVGIQLPITLALPLDLLPSKSVGIASGMTMSIGYIGGLTGPWISGYILDITGSMNSTLVMLSILSLFSLFIALKLPKTGVNSTING
jgi:AAHS family 3-hydroxyphenylpropionic acid transporter